MTSCCRVTLRQIFGVITLNKHVRYHKSRVICHGIINNLYCTSTTPASVKPAAETSTTTVSAAEKPEELGDAGKVDHPSFIKRFGLFWKALVLDYVNTGKDLADTVLSKPLKALVYGSVLSFILYAAHSDPSEQSFHSSLIDSRCKLLQLSDATRNKFSERYVSSVLHLLNEDRLRRYSLGVCSVMVQQEHSGHCAAYPARCKYLSPRYRHYPQRIVAVGYFNHWHHLLDAMTDYDVNDQEYTAAERMQYDVELRHQRRTDTMLPEMLTL